MDEIYLDQRNQHDYTKQDKLSLLTLSRLTVFFGVFFSIVQATNLFLINFQSNNPITLSWGILSILLTLLNIFYIVWNIQESKRISNTSDLFAERSDNLTSRIIFIIYFIVAISFSLIFLVYKVAQTDLYNYYEMAHQTRLLTNYKLFLDEKSIWIVVLSILNLLVIVQVLFTSYVLTGTQHAIRYYIYTTAILLTAVSFLILNQI